MEYVAAVKLNHEYLADKAVLDSGVDRLEYTEVLVNQTFGHRIFTLTSSLSNIKPSKRLKMMTKQKTSRWMTVAVAALVPMFALFMKATAEPRYVISEP